MKRQKIIRAATTVFYRKGFHAARMDEIADEAGVAKGTLYYNFSSKSKLFAATVIDGMEEITRQISDRLESELPFIEHFHLLVESIITLYLKHREFTNIAFNELSAGIDSDVLTEIKESRSRFIGFIAEILRKGQDSGYLKPLDTSLSAIALVGIIDALCNSYQDRPDTHPGNMIETVFSILSTGLLIRKEDIPPKP